MVFFAEKNLKIMHIKSAGKKVQPNFRPNQKKPVRSNPNFLNAVLPESVVKDSLDVARNIIKDA